MGSPAVAGLIAHVAFLILILFGFGELGPRRTGVFLALWAAGFLARSYVPDGPAWFAPYVALLDVALVFSIFQGDIRLH
jgi:hypothetical protein